MIGDDNPEYYELDGQMLGGYRKFEWKDIAAELQAKSRRVDYHKRVLLADLAGRILQEGRDKSPVERYIVPCDPEERKWILEAAAQVGC